MGSKPLQWKTLKEDFGAEEMVGSSLDRSFGNKWESAQRRLFCTHESIADTDLFKYSETGKQ